MYQKNTYNLCLIFFSVSSVPSVVNKRILLTFTLSLYEIDFISLHLQI